MSGRGSSPLLKGLGQGDEVKSHVPDVTLQLTFADNSITIAFNTVGIKNTQTPILCSLSASDSRLMIQKSAFLLHNIFMTLNANHDQKVLDCIGRRIRYLYDDILTDESTTYLLAN